MPRKKSESPELRVVDGHNDLGDSQKKAIITAGVQEIADLNAEKNSVIGQIRGVRKRLKADGFSRAEVDYALWIRGVNPQIAKDRMEKEIRVALWFGKPLGFQSAMEFREGGAAAE